jgi:hypothetical protein
MAPYTNVERGSRNTLEYRLFFKVSFNTSSFTCCPRPEEREQGVYMGEYHYGTSPPAPPPPGQGRCHLAMKR